MRVREGQDFYPRSYFLHRVMQEDGFTRLIHVTEGFFINTDLLGRFLR